jgi:hypothetical protein
VSNANAEFISVRYRPLPLKYEAVTAWVTLSDPVMTALPLKGNTAAFATYDAVTAYDELTALLAVPINCDAVTEPDTIHILLPEGTISPFLATNSFAIIPLFHISKGE